MVEPQGHIEVEIVWPRPEGLRHWRLRLPAGSTAGAALAAIAQDEYGLQDLLEGQPLGIFARRVEPGQVLQEGDRLEIYRPLQLDPKEARRRRATRTR
ncbi:RnfH family protein [Dyella sp. KULCS107]|uniref:RnfH family protein n=1 Tax=Dyella sp. KULCS107 TaxID=3422216 RepID=UPI003D6E9AA9